MIQRVNSVRMNISVPSDLKELMNVVDAQFNWSRIVTTAFLQAIEGSTARVADGETKLRSQADCRP